MGPLPARRKDGATAEIEELARGRRSRPTRRREALGPCRGARTAGSRHRVAARIRRGPGVPRRGRRATPLRPVPGRGAGPRQPGGGPPDGGCPGAAVVVPERHSAPLSEAVVEGLRRGGREGAGRPGRKTRPGSSRLAKEAGFWVFGAAMGGGTARARYCRATCVLVLGLGGEGAQAADSGRLRPARSPSHGAGVGSLNVSVAAGRPRLYGGLGRARTANRHENGLDDAPTAASKLRGSRLAEMRERRAARFQYRSRGGTVEFSLEKNVICRRSSTVEQPICNRKVAGSSPIASSTATRTRIQPQWLVSSGSWPSGRTS